MFLNRSFDTPGRQFDIAMCTTQWLTDEFVDDAKFQERYADWVAM